MFLEFLTLALFGCASPAAFNRSTTEAEHNWKFVWLEAKMSDYVQSTEPLKVDLNAFTISMWVKDTKGNTHSGYLQAENGKLRVYRYSSNLYLQVGSSTKSCSGCISTDSSLKHIVVTWSGSGSSNGMGAFWVNGVKVYEFTNFNRNYVIASGPTIKLGTIHDSHYPFKGEISYVNIYPVNITTTEQVAQLAKASTSNPSAAMPWSAFTRGAHGDVILAPEYEIFTKSYIDIECRATNMTVYLTRSAFPHLIPSRVGLIDTTCGAGWNASHVYVTTNLDQCGTKVAYTTSLAKYSNYIIPDVVYPPTDNSDSSDTPHAVVNRGALKLADTSLSFHCSYPLLSHATIPAYAVSSSNFDIDGTGTREISFNIELYHDANYTRRYQETEYPIRADAGERIYTKAIVTGDNARMSIWVDKCVATPNSDPDYVTRHELITDGCPQDPTLQFHNATDVREQRFSFEAFRFNARPTAAVYLHCYIDVCRDGNEESRCAKGLELCDS